MEAVDNVVGCDALIMKFPELHRSVPGGATLPKLAQTVKMCPSSGRQPFNRTPTPLPVDPSSHPQTATFVAEQKKVQD